MTDIQKEVQFTISDITFFATLVCGGILTEIGTMVAGSITLCIGFSFMFMQKNNLGTMFETIDMAVQPITNTKSWMAMYRPLFYIMMTIGFSGISLYVSA